MKFTKEDWRREWQPTAVFLLGKPHEQRTVSYSPWGCKESETTEQLSVHSHTYTHKWHVHIISLNYK